ncbi:MAG: surface-adhesin E family protein [Betaproteobacteria bacterium]
MKKTLQLVLLLVTNPSWAAWVKISETDDAVFYIDPATLRKDGHLRRIWNVQDLNKPDDGARSYRTRYEFDCKNERTKVLSLSTHSAPMAGGETLISTNGSGMWQDIPPDTPGADLLKFVCSR